MNYEFETIYHLAALLSTRAELSPQSAHDVNVGGTMNLLNLAIVLIKGKKLLSPEEILKIFWILFKNFALSISKGVEKKVILFFLQ